MKQVISAIVLATAAPAAITLVSSPVLCAINSISPIVMMVLNICSIVCEFAPIFKFSLPLKYPFITEVIDTNNIDGDNASKLNSASGICIQLHAIVCAKVKTNNDDINPTNPKEIMAILKVLCAPFVSPIANLSDTSFDTALGIPI